MRNDANGFLLSYLWLIRYKSDWSIAHGMGLIHPSISWEEWTRFSSVLLAGIQHIGLDDVNPRYQYGELRLNCLDWIYRLCSRTRSFDTMIRGYKYEYHDYETFANSYLGWLLALFVYLTIVLTAMQVGLGVDQLKDNQAFQSASYGFAVFSILTPILGLSLVGFAVGVAVVFNYLYTQKRRKANKDTSWRLLNASDMQGFIH